MPSDPILSRNSFYVRRRGRPAGSHARNTDPRTMYIPYDWNFVDTTLGAMIEPRQVAIIPTSGGGLTNLNADEIAFNSISELDDNVAIADGCHSGTQLPIDYNTL